MQGWYMALAGTALSSCGLISFYFYLTRATRGAGMLKAINASRRLVAAETTVQAQISGGAVFGPAVGLIILGSFFSIVPLGILYGFNAYPILEPFLIGSMCILVGLPLLLLATQIGLMREAFTTRLSYRLFSYAVVLWVVGTTGLFLLHSHPVA